MSGKTRIAFLSSNTGWGGSEELWSAAAAELAREGITVTVAKAGIEVGNRRVQALSRLGVKICDLRKVPLLPKRLVDWLVVFSWPFDYLIRFLRLRWFLWRGKPDLVVLSQGGNLDGMFYGKRLRKLGVPFCLVVQKAAEMYWPSDVQLGEMQETYGQARRVYFVSHHNKRLTEEQIAMDLPQGEVVWNPFLVPWEAPQPWPAKGGTLKLACVGRLYPREKGQDILLRLLSRPKWRERDISLTFFGAGPHRKGLEQTAKYLGLNNVIFGGHTGDVAEIWRDHAGLVLPSHCEGLPLVLVETMLSGRVAVVTSVAGNPEILEDGVTGFLADAPTEDSLDEALERAWQARDNWPQIGEAAARHARSVVPRSPEGEFAKALLALAHDVSGNRGDA